MKKDLKDKSSDKARKPRFRTSNPLFLVKPKDKSDGLSPGRVYPVFFVDVVKSDSYNPVAVPRADKKVKPVGEYLDDADDVEYVTGIIKKEEPTETVITWLLVGDNAKKCLTWIDSSKVSYES